MGLLAFGLFWAWILGPVAFLYYRQIVVPRRYREIHDRFLSNNLGETLMPELERAKSGAWHYARLLNPREINPKDPESILENQFYYFHGWNRYWFPFLSIVVLSALLLSFSGFWVVDRLSPAVAVAAVKTPGTTPDTGGGDQKTQGSGTPLSRIPPDFVMALMGAYVWSLYEILSRAKSGDLTPVELYDIATRYVVAIPVGYAFSLLVFQTVPPLAAFAVSAFPLRDIRQFFRKQAVEKLNEKTQIGAAPVLGESLVGLGSDTIARLQELNIETFLDLAYADPVKLMIKTGAPIEVVLSWIDQAIVPVYALPHRTALTLYGMPCALDLCEFYARHCFDVDTKQPRAWQGDAAVQALASHLGIPAEFLVDQILRSVFEDPHTQFLIRVWYGPATVHTAL
jgi:hypothetical protein